jgi:thiol-disulfide isomerase/thioredoxin
MRLERRRITTAARAAGQLAPSEKEPPMTTPRIKRLALALCILSAVALSVPAAPDAAQPAAAAVTLKVGDPAPKLQLGKWLKGEPIAALEPGKVYVIECWATWCGPCIASMPHVTKMQAKYKDKGVVVIGVDVWERDAAAPEPFVKKMGDKMGYVVATDDVQPGEGGKMATTWLKAAGRNGIPCSFLVDRKGVIAWIGHPMQMERPLGKLAEDKFDPAEEAKFASQMDALNYEFSEALKAKDNDKALAALDRLAAQNPAMAGQYGVMRMSLLVKKGDYAAANAAAATIADDKEAEDTTRASAAYTLLNAPDADRVDVKLALTLAKRAYESAGKDNWQYQSLLAKAYAANKQFDKAVELETQAVEHAPAQIKTREQAALDEYKQKASEKK